MASDGAPITLSTTQPATASYASPGTTAAKPADGKPLPNSGAATAAPVVPKSAAKFVVGDSASASPTQPASATSSTGPSAPAAPASTAGQTIPTSANSSASNAAAVPKTRAASVDPRALVTQLNKHLNDSGLPDQYRVDPQSSSMIQEINPANGAVIGEFSASEFPSLARSAGALGLLVDSLA